MKVFVALVVASAAASKQSVTTLSSDERATLRAELAQWREEFGAKAAAEGLLPRAPQGSNPLEAETDALQRFYDNKLRIEEARRNNPEATFDYNHPFALMTEAEFKDLVVGRSFQQGLSAVNALPSGDVDLNTPQAASVDWTTGKCVNPIRNQGNCGSCWAFSAVGTSESAHCLASGELLDLSEQQVTSCSTNGYSDGCNGGYEDAAIDYLVSTGVCLERDFPYTSGTTGLTGSCTNSCTKKKLSIGATVLVHGESATVAALNNQPVSVAVEAGNSVWMNYRSGVVSQCPGANSDHAVIAVGYDTSSIKIRNSWSANWGEAGHIRLKRGGAGNGTCNVVEWVSFPTIGGSPKPTTTKPTTKPTTTKPTTKPTTTKPTTKPTTTKPTTKPTTTKPTSKPKTTTPAPTSAQPDGCDNCSGCYYPAGDMCLPDEYTKDDCDYYKDEYNTVWCGN
ncbi:hypothetical protein DYB32_010557 [Aphanomyces invadans]|uniref:Peptidase C1A papain C-terminal domain-containing protein n=1 Tax=Aphanomyces invadans TaxID=157072 RepID=A0A3R6VP18_9STRA|nr:hypothetical protein DYB32_010557 [Aphanomyces invadans]